MTIVALAPLRLSRVCVRKDIFLVRGIGCTLGCSATTPTPPYCSWARRRLFVYLEVVILPPLSASKMCTPACSPAL
eukprot:3554673-Heterocapsa_arctica.AAC.1